MNYDKIEEILSELVMRVANYFKIDTQEAFSAVATSKLAGELSSKGNIHNLTIDELSNKIYYEISNAE